MNVPSHESFSSYLNVEARFILEKVTLLKGTKVIYDRFPISNLYRDSHIVVAIQEFLLRQQKEALQPLLPKALEPVDLSRLIGKKGVINVANKEISATIPAVSIDGAKEA